MFTLKSQQSPDGPPPRWLSTTWTFFLLAVSLTNIASHATPQCPIDNKKSELQANAGCLVVQNGKLLVIQAHSGKVSIPGGAKDHNESAACTAFRETWEETSLLTRPTNPIHRWPNGFVMFQCEVLNQKGKAAVHRPLEVRRVIWLTPEEFSNYKWRFDKQAMWLKNWLLKYNLDTI